MSKLLVKLEKYKRDFDWQDLVDLIDEFGREVDKLENENEELKRRLADGT